MKEKVLSVTFCGGWRFSTGEKELATINGCLKSHGVDLNDTYDFSQASFDFIHDDENNTLVAELSHSNWRSQNYKIRSFLQRNGGIVVHLQSGKIFGFYLGKISTL
jgi:hypothetical protein